MPLADAERGVAGLSQHLGDRRGVVADVAELVREPGSEVRHGTHADGVLRAPGQQRRSGRRTQRRDVEVRELHTVGRQRVDVRGVDVGAVAPELSEPGVVQQHQDDVGCVVAGMRRLVVPRLGVGDGSSDRAFESRWSCHVGPLPAGALTCRTTHPNSCEFYYQYISGSATLMISAHRGLDVRPGGDPHVDPNRTRDRRTSGAEGSAGGWR